MKKQTVVYIEKHSSKWSGYCSRPSEFIKSPESIFLKGYEDLIEKELDYLLNNRNKEGLWDITWVWVEYEKEFAISRNWWMAHLAIENIELLKAFNKI